MAALVTVANASQGGYFSRSWGWIALAFLVAVSLILIVGASATPGPWRIAFAVLMALLGVWVASSATWSITPAGSLREAERMLVYVALAGAIALVLRRGDAPALAGGLLAGSVAVTGYALATRLFPDRFELYDSPTLPYRLSEPIGYWNALGLLAALGVLLAIGVVAHGRRRPFVAFAGGSLPILATTLYFSFSRGAWAALFVGGVALTALDPRRLRLVWTSLAVLAPSVIAVAVASQQHALTTEDSPRADAVSEGHRFALVVAGVVVASAALALAARWAAQRVPASRIVARAVDVALASLGLIAIVVGLALAGGPSDALAEIEERFDAPAAVGDPNLNARLFSASGNGRAESIGVAWDAGQERPLVGLGAGSYQYFWYEERQIDLVIRDAHSLYAETFAELGVVGLGLLGLTLLLPILAAVGARRNRLVPAATAAFVAWAVHAAMDWDWEVVGVTITALLAGGVGLVAGERPAPRPLPTLARVPLLVGALALTAVALISLVGNQALFAGREAIARGDWTSAEEHGERAESLLPWSFEPHIVLGDAAAGLGSRQGALAAYRRAVEIDPRNWIAWLRVAQVARGAERRAAYQRAHALNPRARDFPGEPEAESG